MPVWFVLICGVVLERKKLPEIGKVSEIGKAAWPEIGKVPQKLPSILWTALAQSLI